MCGNPGVSARVWEEAGGWRPGFTHRALAARQKISRNNYKIKTIVSNRIDIFPPAVTRVANRSALFLFINASNANRVPCFAIGDRQCSDLIGRDVDRVIFFSGRNSFRINDYTINDRTMCYKSVETPNNIFAKREMFRFSFGEKISQFSTR